MVAVGTGRGGPTYRDAGAIAAPVTLASRKRAAAADGLRLDRCMPFGTHLELRPRRNPARFRVSSAHSKVGQPRPVARPRRRECPTFGRCGAATTAGEGIGQPVARRGSRKIPGFRRGRRQGSERERCCGQDVDHPQPPGFFDFRGKRDAAASRTYATGRPIPSPAVSAATFARLLWGWLPRLRRSTPRRAWRRCPSPGR